MTEIERLTQETRNELAAALGIEPEQLRARDTEWMEKLEQGVIVKVSVGRWRATKKLTYHNLGIPAPRGKTKKEIDSLIRLGHVLLMPDKPRKRFESLETRSRNAGKKHGSESPWGWFVTAEKFDDLDTELKEIQSSYLNLGFEITTPDGWKNLKIQIADQSRAAARAAYKRASEITKQDGSTIDRDEDSFVENYARSILRMLPSREYVRQSFYMNFDYSYAPLMSQLESERVKMERVAHERAIMAETERLEVAKNNAELDMHRRIAGNAAARKAELIDSFLVGFARKLYGIFNETSDAMLDTTRNNNKVHHRSITQAENLIKNINQLLKFGVEIPDIELMHETMISKLDEIKTGSANVTDIDRTLEAVATVSRAGLVALGETPRKKRVESVPNVPTMSEVESARRTLRGESEMIPVEFPVAAKRRRKAESELIPA